MRAENDESDDSDLEAEEEPYTPRGGSSSAGEGKRSRELIASVEAAQCVTSMLSVLDAATSHVSERVQAMLAMQAVNASVDGGEQESADNDEIITAIATDDCVVGYFPLAVRLGLDAALFPSIDLRPVPFPQMILQLHKSFPKSVNTVIKTIVLRLQRITMLSVNRYFGLTKGGWAAAMYK